MSKCYSDSYASKISGDARPATYRYVLLPDGSRAYRGMRRGDARKSASCGRELIRSRNAPVGQREPRGEVRDVVVLGEFI